MARNIVLETYRASGRYLAPYLFQVKSSASISIKERPDKGLRDLTPNLSRSTTEKSCAPKVSRSFITSAGKASARA